MKISRRDFIKYCGISAAALGLSTIELSKLEEVLANPLSPTVIWLQGSSCTGCSVSFLNRISTTAPLNSADVLINSINLRYHPNIMALAGDLAVAVAEDAYSKGGYILIVEGGIPTNYNGGACVAWTYNGVDVTFQEAVTTLASKATKVICVGTCSSFGGVAAAPPNPTGVKNVQTVTGIKTLNIAGCPPHPDWIVWAVVQLLLGNSIAVDTYGRPTTIYGKTVHSQCPRRGTDESSSYGVDNRCLRELGCRGPQTGANCPAVLWNGRVNWCIDSNAPCLGCTEPGFPGTAPFYQNNGG